SFTNSFGPKNLSGRTDFMPGITGAIIIDPWVRMGGSLGGRADANGSTYGYSPASGPCAAGYIGCVDDPTDPIWTSDSALLFLAGTTSSGQYLTMDGGGGNTFDKFLCRDHSTPFAPAASNGTCTSGTCDAAFATGFAEPAVIKHIMADGSARYYYQNIYGT